MEKGVIISAQTAGLANRLKGLITSVRIADKTKRKVVLYWPKTFDVGSDFSELFSFKISMIEKDPLKEIGSDNAQVCNSFEDCQKHSEKNWIFTSWRFLLFPNEVKKGFSKILSPKNGKAIDLEYERIPPRLKKEFSKYIKQLKPQDSIQRKVDSFIKEHRFRNIVGMHVRRTDFQYTLDGRGNVSTDEKFFAQIEKIINQNPAARFFLATDSKDTLTKFIDKFGEKIIFYPKKGWDKSSSEFTEEALIEMLLLSKTRYMLGTYLSTFTEMAWWFGEAKAKIEIIGDNSAKKNVLKNIRISKSANNRFSPIREFLKILRAKSKLFRKLLDSYTKLRFSGKS